MTYADICASVQHLKRQYDETDPFRLCKAMGVLLLFKPMGKHETAIKGFSMKFKRIRSITVNSDLPEIIQKIIVAHELGHGLSKDVLKQQIMNFGNLLVMAVVVWLAVRWPQLHEAFGFTGINYGMGYVLASIGLGLVSPLIRLGINAYSRLAEYRADRQAVKEGYGLALVTALKKLSRENFSHLAPSPVLVALEYSHPPLSQRIDAIEKALEQT